MATKRDPNEPFAREFVFEEWLQDVVTDIKDLFEQYGEDVIQTDKVQQEAEKLQQVMYKTQREKLVAARDFINTLIERLDQKMG